VPGNGEDVVPGDGEDVVLDDGEDVVLDPFEEPGALICLDAGPAQPVSK